MLFMCTTKFDVETEQLALIDEYLSTQEKQAKKEQTDAQKKEEEFDPISDDEEDLSTSEVSAETIQTPSARAIRKRRATSGQPMELEDDDEEFLYLIIATWKKGGLLRGVHLGVFQSA
jgi:hypothetical protein